MYIIPAKGFIEHLERKRDEDETKYQSFASAGLMDAADKAYARIQIYNALIEITKAIAVDLDSVLPPK